MKVGRSTRFGWAGIRYRDGKIYVGLTPRWALSLDVRQTRTVDEMMRERRRDAPLTHAERFWLALWSYTRNWFKIGRPWPWQMVRRARQYAYRKTVLADPACTCPTCVARYGWRSA